MQEIDKEFQQHKSEINSSTARMAAIEITERFRQDLAKMRALEMVAEKAARVTEEDIESSEEKTAMKDLKEYFEEDNGDADEGHKEEGNDFTFQVNGSVCNTKFDFFNILTIVDRYIPLSHVHLSRFSHAKTSCCGGIQVAFNL